MSKSIFASRTFWVNALTIAAAVLAGLSGMTEHIPAEAMPWIVSALGVVNLALRVMTTGPVTLPGDK